MDLDQLQTEIEEELGVKIGLRYKVIFRGRNKEDRNNKRAIRAIHIDLDTKNFTRNFNKYMEKYGQSKTGFKNRRRMRF